MTAPAEYDRAESDRRIIAYLDAATLAEKDTAAEAMHDADWMRLSSNDFSLAAFVLGETAR